MSRIFNRNNRTRQPLLSTGPRFSRSKEHLADLYQPSAEKKQKPLRKYTMAKKRKAPSPISDDEDSSSLSSETADDASDEESQSDEDEEDDDEPAFVTPSRTKVNNGAGFRLHQLQADQVSIADSSDSMFGDYDDLYEDNEDPRISPEENRKRFEDKVFAESDGDNDDDIYLGVEDISESEDEGSVGNAEEKELLEMLSEEDDEEGEDNDDPDFYLNQIDGLSAYGFGDDSEGSIHFPQSSQGSDTAEVHERHVRFDFEDNPPMMRYDNSPTITRALLPSALPESTSLLRSPQTTFADRQHGLPLEDPYDSDLTDDCLPEQAHHSTPNVLQHQKDEEKKVSSSPTSPRKKAPKKQIRRKGPPRGVFIDEGDKAFGILDPTGKIILMTNPHLLGDDFARRYGASQTSSPDAGFQELIDESDMEDSPSQINADLMGGTDIMLAGLNSAFSDSMYRGQAIGPLEAFYPAAGFDFGDYAIDPDDLEEDFRPDPNLGEDVIQLDDVIQFDDDSEDDSDAPTSPIFMPPSHELSGLGNVNNEFAHLNNSNVTAFRRNADPRYAALHNNTPFRDIALINTPDGKRKRKANESPYTSSHYKGVTPVHRMRDPNQPATPDSAGPSKRRRIMT